MPKPKLNWLLVAVPLAFVLELTGAEPVAIFAVSAVAILPLAGLIGHATEDLALHLGGSIGGLLNATFGNVTELIIAAFLIIDGQFEVVKASITGSIIGNVLLVLGLSFVAGGWGRGEQKFSTDAAELHSAALFIAVTGLLMPALFSFHPEATGFRTEAVSIGVSVVLIAVYVSGLVYSLVTDRHQFASSHAAEGAPVRSKAASFWLLATATAGVGFVSEFLVGSLEPTVEKLGLSKLFVGLILVPIIGNAAEHSSAVLLAIKDKMSVSVEIAVGSSTQIALFVAPVLILFSAAIGKPMDLIFTGFEIAAVAIASIILGLITLDGRSNWLEGVQLLGAYSIMAISFFFL